MSLLRIFILLLNRQTKTRKGSRRNYIEHRPAARGPHVVRQVVLCNPLSHLNCVYATKVTQTFRRLCINTYCKFSTCGPRTRPHEPRTNTFGQTKTDCPSGKIKIVTSSDVWPNCTLQLRTHCYVRTATWSNFNLKLILLLVETLLPFYNLHIYTVIWHILLRILL